MLLLLRLQITEIGIGNYLEELTQTTGIRKNSFSHAQAQITVAIGIPLIYLWFLGIPPGSDASTFGARAVQGIRT